MTKDKIYSPEAESKKRYRNKLLALGLCHYCGNEPHKPGRKSCQTCAIKNKPTKPSLISLIPNTIVGWEKTS